MSIKSFKEMGYTVDISNVMIQKSRYSLSVQQQKVLLYMVSKVKPQDEPQTLYSIRIQDFCEICGMNITSGTNYEDIKEALLSIDRVAYWLKLPNQKKEVRIRWLNRLQINYGSGDVEYSFHETVSPFVFELQREYTQFTLLNVLPMRSKYSIRLYELMKSYENMVGDVTIDLEELKTRMDATTYKNLKDFKRRALDKAVEEINYYTDIKIYYQLKKEKSRAYNKVVFRIV